MTIIVLDATTFKEDFPEFDSVSDSVVNSFIEQAICYVSNVNYGRLKDNCRKLAIELMTAHLLTLNQRIQSGLTSQGQLQNASIDGVSVSMVAPNNKTQFEYWINQTPYGQRYYALLASLSAGGLFFGGSNQRVFR